MASLLRLPFLQRFRNSHIQSESDPPTMRVIETNYTSKPVDIATDFLKATPPDALPITVERIDFSASPLPEYAPYYAAVLDNVLSASECAQLLRLAEQSSPTGQWDNAMLNMGPGREILAPEVRLCGRQVPIAIYA
jgi:hypothetical protein